MKIKLAYEEHEKYIAELLTEMLKRKVSVDDLYKVKINRSELYKPFFHTYLTITKNDKSWK